MKFPVTRSARLGQAAVLAVMAGGLLAAAPGAHAATRTGGFEIAFTAPNSREWHIEPNGVPIETLSALAPDTSPAIAALPDGINFEESFVASDGTLWVANSAAGGQQFKPCSSPYRVQAGSGPAIATTPGGDWHLVTTQHLSSGGAAIIEAGSDLVSRHVCAAEVSDSPGGGTPDIATLATGGYADTFTGSDGLVQVADAGGVGFAGNGLGISPGTSPVIAAGVNGGWEIAFHAGDDHLWTVDSAGHQVQTPNMLAPNSGVGIAALSTGGYEIVFEAASDGLLREIAPDGTVTMVANGLGMAAHTSPAIAADNAGGFKIAFHAGVEDTVWTVDSLDNVGFDTRQAIWANTSPAITYLKNAGILF